MNTTRGEEYIYRKVLHAYQLEDAHYWVDDELEHDDDLTDIQRDILRENTDYEWLVYLFNDKADCNIADNDTWSWLVCDYLDDLFAELEMEIEE